MSIAAAPTWTGSGTARRDWETVVSFVSELFRYRGWDPEPELDLLALIHELAHIFGAEHTQDTRSIMHEGFGYRTGLDQKNRDVIMKNKFCPFANGQSR